MVKIPTIEDNPYTTQYMLNNKLIIDGKRSQRLGMASLGDECVRRMWFGFRWAKEKQIITKIQRLFGFGDTIENILINDLESIGITVTDRQKWINGWGGHIAGKIDGIAHNVPEAPLTPHLLEVKSMNDANFNKLKRYGIIEAQPKHYVQCQMYMGKLDLTRALYIAMNKNTSEVFVIRIEYNKGAYNEYMQRAVDVVSHETAPPNLFGNINNMACKFCDYQNICYDGEPLLKSCRSCVRCDIEDDGKWSCSLLQKQLTYDDQVKACDNYRPISM